jgi:hypothetical protein
MKKNPYALIIVSLFFCFFGGCATWNIALQNNQIGPFHPQAPNPGFKAAILSQIYYLEHSKWPQHLSDLQALARQFQLPFKTDDIQDWKFTRAAGGGLAVHFHCVASDKQRNESWDEDLTVRKDGDQMEIRVQGNVPNPVWPSKGGMEGSDYLNNPAFLDVKIKVDKDIRADLPAYVASAYHALHAAWPQTLDDLRQTAQDLQLPYKPEEYTDGSLTLDKEGNFILRYNYQREGGRMPREAEMKLEKDGTIKVAQMPHALFSKRTIILGEEMNFDQKGEEADRRLADDEKYVKKTFLTPFRDWDFQLGFGLVIPKGGSLLDQNYEGDFGGNLGVGFRVADPLSILLVIDGGGYNPRVNSLSNGTYSYSQTNFELIGKWRMGMGNFRPYLYAGPGFSTNTYNLNFTYNGLAANASYNESDFVAEGGLGFEIRFVPGFNFFVQGGVAYDLTSANLKNYGVDSPIVTYPIMFGILMGR